MNETTQRNAFGMIDVGSKLATHRVAVATGVIEVGAEAFALVRDRKLPKGDALTLAEIAGLTGAKRAFEMIPLCHPLALDHVKIITELLSETNSIRVYCYASAHAKTGVEMEALAGVNAALLTIYDLCKMVEPALQIGDVHLLLKLGGKKGLWRHPAGVSDWVLQSVSPAPEQSLSGKTAAVLTMSDRAYQGVYEDKSGAVLKEILVQAGAEIVDYRVVPDEKTKIQAAIEAIVAAHRPALLICTGGTGVAPRDVTPEAVRELCEREIPGVGELLRADGARHTPYSWSSRSMAGILGDSIIVTLPGNPNAVKEGMDALLPLLIPHLIRTLRGEQK